MNCTEKSKNGNCSEPVATELEWTEQICPGWLVKVNRVYCSEHAEQKMQTLARRGIAVNQFSGDPV